MDWICQLGEGYMLGIDGGKLHRVRTGYPYPTLSRPQMDILYNFLHGYYGSRLSWEEFVSNYKKLINSFNTSFIDSDSDCLDIADVLFHSSSRQSDADEKLTCIYRTEYWRAYRVCKGYDINYISTKLGDLYHKDFGSDSSGLDLCLIVPNEVYDQVALRLGLRQDTTEISIYDAYLFEGIPFAFFCKEDNFGDSGVDRCYSLSYRMGYFLSKLFPDMDKRMVMQSMLRNYFEEGWTDNTMRKSRLLKDFITTFPHETLGVCYEVYKDILVEFWGISLKFDRLNKFVGIMDGRGLRKKTTKFNVRDGVVYGKLCGLFDAYSAMKEGKDEFGVFGHFKDQLNSSLVYRHALVSIGKDDKIGLDFSKLVDADIALDYFRYTYGVIYDHGYEFDPLKAYQSFLRGVVLDTDSFSSICRRLFISDNIDFIKNINSHIYLLRDKTYEDGSYGILYLFFYSLYFRTLKSSLFVVNVDRVRFVNILSYFKSFEQFIDYKLLLRKYSIIFKKLFFVSHFDQWLYSINMSLNLSFDDFVLLRDLRVEESEDKNSIDIVSVPKDVVTENILS